MFTVPDATDFANPGDDIELMERYILTLVSVEDTGVSIYAKDKNDPKAARSMKWVWNVHQQSGAPILDGDLLWEFWEWTENRAGFRQDGAPSKARARLNALAGRELTDDEVKQIPMEKLPGRRCSGIFQRVKKKDANGQDTGRMKLDLLTVAPYKNKEQAAPAGKAKAAEADVAPVPAPVNGTSSTPPADQGFQF